MPLFAALIAVSMLASGDSSQAPDPAYDLQVVALKGPLGSAVLGDSLSVDVTVENKGSATAPASLLFFGDRRRGRGVARVRVPRLGPGQSAHVTVRVASPTPSDGTVCYTGVIEPDPAMGETRRVASRDGAGTAR